jgi:hypothetical protein
MHFAFAAACSGSGQISALSNPWWVPLNGPALGAFRHAVGYLWRTVLRRRSQGNHMPWRRVRRHIPRWFPPAKVCHPYLLVRLGVLTQGGSRMR